MQNKYRTSKSFSYYILMRSASFVRVLMPLLLLVEFVIRVKGGCWVEAVEAPDGGEKRDDDAECGGA